MGMPTVGVYVLVATVVAPAVIKLGVDPIAAHMFVLYFGMISMITPPVALAAYTAASIARTEPMWTGFQAVRFAWPAFIVPFLFIASPTLVLVGNPLSIAVDTVTAIFGIWLGAAAIVGFLARSLSGPLRLAFAATGLALLLPSQAFPSAGWVNLAGVVVGFGLLMRELRGVRRPRIA
jgi:TRAP-type uncharacterized transport system fused permease subunit